MRNLVFVVMVLASVLLSVNLWGEQDADIGSSYYDNAMRDFLLENEMTDIVGQNYLYYITGHRGYSWAVVYKDSLGYSFRRGYLPQRYRLIDPDIEIDTSQFEKRNGYVYARISDQDKGFDTIAFLLRNIPTLQWGLDSLCQNGQMMRHLPQSEGVSGEYTSLRVYDTAGRRTFDSRNSILFSGPDSVTFNDKFSRLSLVMWWLACPWIREFMPDSVIYGVR